MKFIEMKPEDYFIITIVFLCGVIGIIFFQGNNTNEKLENCSLELNNSLEEIELLNNNISLLLEENKELKQLPLFNFEPSIKEVKKILKEDKTDENEYIENEYDCIDYSADLTKAFLDKKIHSCVSWVYFDDTNGHALVTINTKEHEIIYIEPQNDKIIYELNLGDDYCSKVFWDCELEIVQLKSCYI